MVPIAGFIFPVGFPESKITPFVELAGFVQVKAEDFELLNENGPDLFDESSRRLLVLKQRDRLRLFAKSRVDHGVTSRKFALVQQSVKLPNSLF